MIMKQHGPLKTAPQPPSNLPENGKAIWRDVTAYLLDRHLLHSGDVHTISSFCWAAARLQRMEAAIDEQGPLLDNGKPHPAVAACNGTASAVAKLAGALGLAPISRARLTAAVREAPTKEPDAHEAAWVKLVPKGKRA
jgi:P27 family predicted phage terminase small subunit